MTLTRGDAPAGGHPGGAPPARPAPARDLAPVALVDLLDRLLGTGVVLAGDVVISLAGVDLVEIRLHLLVTSVRAEMARERELAAQRARPGKPPQDRPVDRPGGTP